MIYESEFDTVIVSNDMFCYQATDDTEEAYPNVLQLKDVT